MRLTKHQGLGNDFLVWLDVDEASDPSTSPGRRLLSDMARAACDRHRGVGADGLLHVTAPASPPPLLPLCHRVRPPT